VNNIIVKAVKFKNWQ